jgi:hypothetical protein
VDPVGADASRAISLHRYYCGMDDSGVGTSAVACLWLMRTAVGSSPLVSVGNGLFTLLGFMGLYAALSVLFLFLIYLEVQRGPSSAEHSSSYGSVADAD